MRRIIIAYGIPIEIVNADDLAIISNNDKNAETMFNKIGKIAEKIGLKINTNKTEYMSINQDINTRKIKSLKDQNIKVVEDFKYLGSYIGSTEHDVNILIAKAWAALNSMKTIWKSGLKEKLKKNFSRATVESVLVYGSVTWTLTKALNKKIDGAYIIKPGKTPDKQRTIWKYTKSEHIK